jgi:hypothetical protein
MSYKEKLDKCLISLELGDTHALFIILAADGTICRKGNGDPHASLPMLKGHSDLGHFEAFMRTVQDGWFAYSGAIKQEPIIGTESKLLIVFSGANNEEAGFKCTYGSESQGPPCELTDMLITAVKLTDGWYHDEQQQMMIPHEPTAIPRGWWEFWRR